jgi:hypothetical protein
MKAISQIFQCVGSLIPERSCKPSNDFLHHLLVSVKSIWTPWTSNNYNTNLWNFSVYCSWVWTQNFRKALLKAMFTQWILWRRMHDIMGLGFSAFQWKFKAYKMYFRLREVQNLRTNTSDCFSNSIRILCFSMVILFFYFLAPNMSHVSLTRLKE